MMTADEMIVAMNTYHIGLERSRDLSGWHAKMHRTGKPLNKNPTSTPQEAVEIAKGILIEAEANRLQADGGRLFEILSRGAIKYRTRMVSRVVNGAPAEVEVWDIQRVADNAVIVSGERSLRAGILEAERLGLI